MIEAIGGSFRDPCNRVYTVADASMSSGVRVLRGVDATTKANFEKLASQEFYNVLLNEGHLVQSWLVDDPEDTPARDIMSMHNWTGVLEHEAIPVVTYPYEWTFGMLRMAALLHLRVLSDALASGWTVKDSTPFNIQFLGTRPVFIDIPSFVPWEDGEPWLGYRQFCACFLTPLLMRAHLGVDHLSIMRAFLDGIPPTEAIKYFSGLNRFKKGVMSHIMLPARVENRILAAERDDVPAKNRVARTQNRSTVIALVDSMSRLIRSLSIKIDHTDWSEYDQTHTYDDTEHTAKKSFVQHVVQEAKPYLIWDIGCNTGTFSRLSTEHATHVVAVDSDHNAIEKLFHAERKAHNDGNLLPLVLNLANPSPDQGWAGNERHSFGKRVKPNMVLVLALIHHIRISSNIPLDLFLAWLRQLDSEVVIEFVNREDEMVIKLLTNKKEQYSDYNIDNFLQLAEKQFHIKARRKLKNGKREIFHLLPA